MIFPGMDPYLERPGLWPDVLLTLLGEMRRQLQPRLAPRYYAAVEQRVFVETDAEESDRQFVPDVLAFAEKNFAPAPFGPHGHAAATLEADAPRAVLTSPATFEVKQRYLEIRDLENQHRVVTVIELLSPSNKKAGEGRDLYWKKQRRVHRSTTHLVEIDLLRHGDHTVGVPLARARRAVKEWDYLVCVDRYRDLGSRRYELHPRRLPEPLPRFGVPLADEDPDVTLDLEAALAEAYAAGAYHRQIDYRKPCVPALNDDAQRWANERIEAAFAAAAQRAAGSPSA